MWEDVSKIPNLSVKAFSKGLEIKLISLSPRKTRLRTSLKIMAKL
jgi:hypothetical protein